jgi:uncharacterized membrane protein
MGLELSILMAALVISMATRPWRLLSGGTLLTPLLATLVILPWLWALPRLHTMPLQLQFSGACAVTLMLGWPLAVPVLVAVTLVSGLLAPADFNTLLEQVVWQGLVPATLAMFARRRCCVGGPARTRSSSSWPVALAARCCAPSPRAAWR